MNRFGRIATLVAALVLGSSLSGGMLAPSSRAAEPDPSDIALVFDFSASILDDKANRERFAAALDGMADRVNATSADLVAGDATVSLVQFASKAADITGCTELRLLDSAETVNRFAECLRSVARSYRRGVRPSLTNKIGVDTNYVAAMQQADKHLPDDSVRPAMILFTDGKHDVPGTPVSQVQTTRDSLFGNRTPFALLPVGMGLDPGDRGALEAGLANMRITRDMPACVSGATFDWPQVVFDSAADAGNAVGVALQEATCTFTVAATPQPTATPVPPAAPVVFSVAATPGDGMVTLKWSALPPAASGSQAVVDYAARCRPETGDPITSTEGVSLEPTAVVEGLADGVAYTCEVAVVTADGEGPWTPVAGTITPLGLPAAPGKPSVGALNGAVSAKVEPAPSGAATIHYECSPDGGATWPTKADVASSTDPTAQVLGLTNGVDYVCRAFAINAIGQSDASPISDIVRPCASSLDCNPVLGPVIGVLGAVFLVGLLAVAFVLLRSRRRGYVLAVVDVVHTANLGYGSKIGIGFIRDPVTKRVTEVVSDKGKTAEIRIRHMGGHRFEIRDRHGRQVVNDGDAFVIADSVGGRHEVVLRAFDTNAASPVATRH